MARLTLNGMYEYEPSIFDGMILPEDYDKPTLLFEILQRSGQLYPYHQQPLILKEGIRLWFARNYLNFDRTMAALTAEYNPIENVYENREETTTYGSSTIMSGGHKDANSGKDTVTHSEKDTTERSYDDYKDTTERSYDEYKDTTERSYDDYKDSTERTHTNFKEDTTHDYTDNSNIYTEVTKMQGSHVTEQQVSAFDSSAYQPASKEGESYGTNMSGSSDPRQDEKTITGKYKDTKETTGSYKDTETVEGTYKDENTIEGTYKDEKTIEGSYKDETSYGHKITTDNGLTMTRTYQQETESHAGTDTFEVFRHGNIGVTSNQHMINEELELRKFDIYVDIARRFENEFIVQVY